jgi:membrane dipeptidase
LIPVFDGHNDVLLRLHRAGVGPGPFLEGREGGHLDLPRARRGGFGGGLFAIFVPPADGLGFDPAELRKKRFELPTGHPIHASRAEAETLEMISLLESIERESEGAVEIVGDATSLRRCLERGTLAAVIHVEGAEAIAEDLSNLDALEARGLRSVGLVWSRANAFGHGVPIAYPGHPDVGPGLTEAGRALVRHCSQRGLVVDCAHLNERGFWEVAELSERPLVVSHAAAHALCPTARNVTDAQLDRIAESGGVLGLTFNVGDLRPDGRWRADTPLDVWLDHLDHAVARIGVEHVAIGSDFDGALMPAPLADAAGLATLLDAVEGRGYDERARRAIAHENWLRVLETTWS